MLIELVVSDLGVVAELAVVFDGGMTALTGETGAGKTLVVEAIDLLVGGRADGAMVRHGAAESVVEGRFALGDDEVVLRRVVPREGRSRAYVNGRLATVGELAEWGRRLVDLHGQHAHQSLLSTAVQRGSLDHFAGIDLEPMLSARKALAALEEQLAALGGDERERAREVDLLRFQLDDIDGAALTDVAEDERLDAEEDLLGDALMHREAAAAAVASLGDEAGAEDRTREALAAIEGRAPFTEVEARLRTVSLELADVTSELRAAGETIEDDPERLNAIRDRRKLLHDLRRKYGETLGDVIAFRDTVATRIADLEARDATAARLEAERDDARAAVHEAEAVIGAARRAAAPKLAKAVESHLAPLALDKARIVVDVGEDDPGDDVSFLLATNPGVPPRPLVKVASGGELARTMLALRLVLSEAPDTLVFDEVDAGVGGTAAIAVGRALADIATDHQVLVVTHLPQVAAFAHRQLVINKKVRKGETHVSAKPVDGDDRVVELARMLSGSPDSVKAQAHAKELLADAGSSAR
jgi:DNA repair protein RecN (Recombination protein N)